MSAIAKDAPARTSLPPNQTLYITNLPSAKIQKTDLRRELYTLCSTYGPVLDVVALKSMKMRGQAHVVYRDIQAATQAMRALQGFDFLGREMKIQYAKSKSDTIAKLDGTFRMPSAAAGAVTATELQQSIFNAPPSAVTTTTTLPPPPPPSTLQVPAPTSDHDMGDATSPGASVAGQKRRREEEEEEEEEDSEGDVAMDEDSDDD